MAMLALATAAATAPTASAAVTTKQAAARAVSALGVRTADQPVIVFRSGAALSGGSVITQAGTPASPRGQASTLGIVSTKAPFVLRVPSGRPAWMF